MRTDRLAGPHRARAALVGESTQIGRTLRALNCCAWIGLCCGLWACDRTAQLADSQRVAARPGKLVSDATAIQEPALRVLEKCAAAYQRVTSYEDSGRVVLSYQVDGQQMQDVAPLAVAFDAPNRLGIKAYQLIAGVSGNRFRLRIGRGPDVQRDNAQIDDGQSSESRINHATPLMKQVVSRALPPTLNMAWLMSDPVVSGQLSAGLAGTPPQLELLLGDQPFRALLDGATEVKLDGHGTEAGQSFQIINVLRGSARYRLWISATSSLLRRIELPTDALPPAMLADKRISDLHLSIELDDPRLGASVRWDQWAVPVDPLDQMVRYFVVPVENVLDQRLGQPLPAFRLPGVGNQAELDTSHHAQQGKIQILAWVADHAACRTTLEQIADALQRVPVQVREQVTATAIWAEAQPPAGLSWAQLKQQWQIDMPLVQDLDALGRDLLRISDAPTVVVLDSQHRLQWLQGYASPELSVALSGLISRLAAGENLGAAMVKRNQLERERFTAELWSARASDAVSGAFTEPTAYPPAQLTLMPTADVPLESEVLAFHADQTHNLWLVNARGAIDCFNADGARQRTLDSGWTPTSKSNSTPVRLAIDNLSNWIAMVGHLENELLLIEASTGRRWVVSMKPQSLNDLCWLNTPAGLRLGAISDHRQTIFIDPQRAQQHSGQTPASPMALLPRPTSDALASGYVILSDGRVEPLLVQDEGGASSALQALPVSGPATSSAVRGDNESSATGVAQVSRQLTFKPGKGPWSYWSGDQGSAVLARGWSAQDEPAVFILDTQLQQQWHAPLPVDAATTSIRISTAEDPRSSKPIWVVSTGEARLHFFSLDGRLIDHCQFAEPVRGVALNRLGDQLTLWVAHPNRLSRYLLQ